MRWAVAGSARNGGARKSIRSTSENIVVLTPMPSASVPMTATANLGCVRIRRSAWRTSSANASSAPPPRTSYPRSRMRTRPPKARSAARNASAGFIPAWANSCARNSTWSRSSSSISSRTSAPCQRARHRSRSTRQSISGDSAQVAWRILAIAIVNCFQLASSTPSCFRPPRVSV